MPHYRQAFLNSFFVSAFAILFAWQATSQTQYINFRHYSLADGLSAYKATKVLQDRFGFMWIATQDGLNRFDGKDIIIYNKSARGKHLLLGSDITDMVEDSTRNILWVTSSYGGLNGIDLKTGTVQHAISVADSGRRFPDPWLRTIFQNGDDLWIGTNNGITIFNIKERQFKDPGAFPPQKVKNSDNKYDVNILFKDEFGRIWAFSGFGIVLYSAADYSVISSLPFAELGLPEGYFSKRFSSYQPVKRGQLLLATNNGIKRISYDQSAVIKNAEELIAGAVGKNINYLNFDRLGNLWFATDEGLYKRNAENGALSHVEDVNLVDQKKWTQSINTIFFDYYNNFWLGTLQGFAIATKTNTPFINFFQSADFKTKINRANFIFPITDTSEYICAWDGLFRVENPSRKIQRLKEGSFWHIFRHRDGNFLTSTDKKYFVFQPPDRFMGVEEIYPELAAISDENISSSISWDDSLFYLGSERGNGVYEWNYKRKKNSKT